MPRTEHVNDGSGFLHVSSEEVVWRSEYTLGVEYLVGRLDLATGEFSTLWEAQLDTGGGVDPAFDANPQLMDVRATTRVWADIENPPALSVEVAGNEPLALPDVEPIGQLSADGSFLLTPTGDDDSHGAAIVDVGTGETWNLWERNDDFYAWISWSYSDVAVVQADPGGGGGGGPVLACHAVERECDLVKTQGEVVLPHS